MGHPVPDDIHRGKSDSDDHDDFESKIWLKQWITTDRCTLVDVVELREDSFENWTQKSSQLSKHLHLAEEQSPYIKRLKTPYHLGASNSWQFLGKLLSDCPRGDSKPALGCPPVYHTSIRSLLA